MLVCHRTYPREAGPRVHRTSRPRPAAQFAETISEAAKLSSITIAGSLAKEFGEKSYIPSAIGRISEQEEQHQEQKLEGFNAAILTEIRKALCGNDARYRKEVQALEQNGRLLIGAIAGYVAALLGVATAIIAALVASLLRLVLMIGIRAFCEATKV